MLSVHDNLTLDLGPGISSGTPVVAGSEVGRASIARSTLEALTARSATNRMDSATLTTLRAFEGPLQAPVDGIVDLGDGKPAIVADGIDVVAGLTPLQLLRYMSVPFRGTATVETVVGARSLPCDAIWVQPADSDGSTELHCRLPSYAETAPSLRAQVELTSDVLENVTVVPNMFLVYDQAADGYAIRVRDGETVTEHPVTVGVTDGVVRVVETDVPDGAELVAP